MKALILMTRIPIPNKTKTRLMDIFTGHECAEIHKCFLLDLFNMFNYIKDDIDIFLAYTPKDSLNVIDNIIPGYISCFSQIGEDLGERMSNSIDKVLRMGYKKIILIGSDIPDIQPNEIKEAFYVLENNDVCLGPTFDGGYYLIGMKKLHRELFYRKLRWGRKSVFEGTVDIANSIGLEVGLAAKHMDIDTKEDIFEFMKKVQVERFSNKTMPKNTIEYLSRFWSEVQYADR